MFGMFCSTKYPMSLVVRKPAFCICENKDADQTAKLISAFVFAIRIVNFLYYLNPKFQALSHLLWLYSPVCVGPGRKPRRSVFSERGSLLYEKKKHDHYVNAPMQYAAFVNAEKMIIFRSDFC